MAEDSFIPKTLNIRPEMDFDLLRKEGIKHAQELSGENWTDYNEHDPGVTILEQLAYAITDLGYRTNMDIKDLLASQEKPELTERIGDREYKTPFYTALDIFPTNPITKFDFRKVLIDRIQPINNAWLFPLNQLQDNSSIKGIYLILVEVEPQYVTTLEDEEKVKKEVIDQLNYHNNFGEAFEDVVILKKQELYLRCSIELEKDAIAEHVHADVLFRLEQFITHPIRFYSLNEMLEKNAEVSDVFEGPRLFNGFIVDKDLKPKDSDFYNTDLLNIIRNIEGVKSVKYLNILEEHIENGSITYKDYYDKLAEKVVQDAVIIEKNKVAVLGKKMYEDVNKNQFFSYFKEDVPINLFQREVDRLFKGLRASVQFKYAKNWNQENNLPIPKGNKKPIKHYHSIQNHFPSIYGLSKEGLPPNLSKERKTYVFQLKGYLMLFEQIMSNYLMQLARFNELFAFENQLDKSYFTQVPWDIPGIYKLIQQINPNVKEEQLKELFEDAVGKLMKGVDDFYDRRLRLLHHMMARVGDTGFEYSFEKFNYYHTPEEHKQNVLKNKLSILESYPLLTRNKSRSFNPSKPYWGTTNYSKLESRVRMQIGLPVEMKKLATPLLSKVAFKGVEKTISLKEIMRRYSPLTLHHLNHPLTGIWMGEAFKNEKDPYWIEDIEIDELLFKRGFWEDNLRIVKSPIKEEPGYFLLFKKKNELDQFSVESEEAFQQLSAYFAQDNSAYFRVMLRHHEVSKFAVEFDRDENGEFLPNPKIIWKVLKRYDDEAGAFRAAYALRNNLLDWNQACEGFYLIDHILLRPRTAENRYLISFADEEYNLSFELKGDFLFDEIQSSIRNKVKAIRAGEFSIQNNNGKYHTIVVKDGKEIGKSHHEFSDKIEVESEIEQLKNYFDSFTDFDAQHSQKVKINRNCLEASNDASMYNFKVTAVLTGWSARFRDKEFRYQVENIFRKHLPAHIAIQFKWYDFNSMLEFEQIYDTWLTAYREDTGVEELNASARNLIDFLHSDHQRKRNQNNDLLEDFL